MTRRTGALAASRPVAVIRVQGPGAPSTGVLLDALRAALDGSGPALLPVPGGPAGNALVTAAALDQRVDDGTALLLPTTGSTGLPKIVEIGAHALLTSARATHTRIGPPGRWLLALPLTHVAGWQVLVRGLLSDDPDDHLPAVVPLDAGFAAVRLAETVGGAQRGGQHGARVRYASLVPTQLVRALEDPAATAALRHLDVVLLGGSVAPEPLRRKASEKGVNVVGTFGSTETCGGCVYDGVPLHGVTARVTADGRLMLGGPVLARGYRGDEELTRSTFPVIQGRRWYLSGDLAEVDDHGVVTVTGRADDVLVTGGENVSPAAVEASLAEHPLVREVVVVGVPDAQWGQAVVAVASLHAADGHQADVLASLRTHVAAALGRHAAPRHLVVVDAVPTRGIGKPDRTAAQRLAEQSLSGPPAHFDR